MKWFTHQVLAVGTAAALHVEGAALFGVLAGAVLPDVLDQRVSKLTPNPQKTFNRIHRGASHWFGWYVALLLLALTMPAAFSQGVADMLRGVGLWVPNKSLALHLIPVVLAGLAYGALSHVVLDMLTPSGVPLNPLSRQKKLSLKLCSTGSAGEYIFLAVSMGLLVLLAGERWLDYVPRVRLW